MIRVYRRHLNQLKYCARGSRAFFERYSWDWAKFLREGKSAEEIRASGDAMAVKAADLAEREASS